MWIVLIVFSAKDASTVWIVKSVSMFTFHKTRAIVEKALFFLIVGAATTVCFLLGYVINPTAFLISNILRNSMKNM